MTVKIRNRLGLHARAAVKFVQLAAKFKAEVTVSKDGSEANGKSIMGLLTLVAGHGTQVGLTTVGPDEEAMMAALVTLVASGFDEGVVPDA